MPVLSTNLPVKILPVPTPEPIVATPLGELMPHPGEPPFGMSPAAKAFPYPGIASWGKLEVRAPGAEPKTFPLLGPLAPPMSLHSLSFEDAIRGAQELLRSGSTPFNGLAVQNLEYGWYAHGLHLDPAAKQALEIPAGTPNAPELKLFDAPRGVQALVTDANFARFNQDAAAVATTTTPTAPAQAAPAAG